MPDFRMTPNAFPIASVIDAAQRNNQLQEQAREAGNRSIIEGLRSIGQVGQSLFDQKVKVAQALAGAHMYAQTPEGQQMLGTNQVADTAQGPVTRNQTASYNPSSGTVTPLKSPVDVRTLATAMLGESPMAVQQQMFERQKQNQQFGLEQRKQAFTEKMKPLELAQQERLTSALTGVRSQQVTGEQQNNIRNQITSLQGKQAQAIKDFPELTGTFISGLLPSGSNAKEEAAFKDYQDTQKQIDDYNRQLYGGGAPANSPLKHMSTADLLAIVNQSKTQ